jgi:predicted O-methyltransferase YrrM
MINRIIRNLSKPHLLPGKLLGKIQWLYAGFGYDESKYIDEQEQRFSKLNLTYSGTQDELDLLYLSNNDIKVEMSSCHHNLFVAFRKKYKFDNILEIGTHSGAGAVLLSTLFPMAKITTIDLPDNHPIFLETYGRNSTNERNEFIRKRDELLNSKSNIKFTQINSLDLTFSNESFDLIWVDGAHGYPVVNIDIINSLRMVNKNGFVVCDDVYKHVRRSDEMYCSTASYETIKELFSANLIKYSLILKRTIKPWGHASVRKYIAILQKK